MTAQVGVQEDNNNCSSIYTPPGQVLLIHKFGLLKTDQSPSFVAFGCAHVTPIFSSRIERTLYLFYKYIVTILDDDLCLTLKKILLKKFMA